MSNDTPDEYYDFVNTAYWRTCSLLLEETVRKGSLELSLEFCRLSKILPHSD